MTNLEVLRAVQHAWPGYCWPFANSAGNAYSLGPSPSPPGATLNESKMIGSAAVLGSHQGRRARAQNQSYHRHAYEDQLLKLSSPPLDSESRNKNNSDVKSERLSPEPNNNHLGKNMNNITGSAHRSRYSQGSCSTPSPSTSPKSQSSNHTRTPSSFPSTPPHPAFTPPMALPPGCFSPAGLTSLGGAMPSSLPGAPTRPQNFIEPPVPRNCSDLMRSLAAKYNNNNNTNNNTKNNINVINNVEYYNNHMAKSLQRQANNSTLSTKQPCLPGNHQDANTENNQAQNKYAFAENNNNDAKNNIHKSLPPPLLPANLPSNNFVMGVQNPLSSLTSSQALLNMVRNASQNSSISRNHSPINVHSAYSRDINDTVSIQSTNLSTSISSKRSADSSFPLDLSSSVSAKRLKTKDTDSNMCSNEEILDDRLSTNLSTKSPELSVDSSTPSPSSNSSKLNYNILTWTVEDVQDFVKSIDLCAEYADVFKHQCIDGWCLSLLTESHLTSSLNMKLGPALKLKSILSTKTGHIQHQQQQQNQYSSCNTCQNSGLNSPDKCDDVYSRGSHQSPNESGSPALSDRRSPYYSDGTQNSHSPVLHIEANSPTPSEK